MMTPVNNSDDSYYANCWPGYSQWWKWNWKDLLDLCRKSSQSVVRGARYLTTTKFRASAFVCWMRNVAWEYIPTSSSHHTGSSNYRKRSALKHRKHFSVVDRLVGNDGLSIGWLYIHEEVSMNHLEHVLNIPSLYFVLHHHLFLYWTYCIHNLFLGRVSLYSVHGPTTGFSMYFALETSCNQNGHKIYFEKHSWI